MNSTRSIRACAFIAALGTALVVPGQLWSERVVPPPPDVTQDGLFGWSVSMEGDLMLVGAPGSSDLGIQSGAAYLFQLNNGGEQQWDLLLKLEPEGITPGARFGTKVLLRDGRAFVSAPLDIVNGVVSGSLYVFDRNAGGTDNWGLTQRVFSPAGSLAMGFGTWFDVGEILVVGAPLYDTTPNMGPGDTGGIASFIQDGSGGFAFVDLYDRPFAGGSFTLFGNACFAPGITPIDSLVNMDTVLYTALPVTGGLTTTESFGLAAGGYGGGFAANDIRMVAQTLTSSYFQVHSFVQEDENAVQEGAVLPDTLLYNSTNRFGEALALDGERMVVGAPGDPIGTPIGFVGVFDHDEAAIGEWSPMLKLVPSDPDFGDLFGRSVSIADANVAVGAPGKGADDRGQVYVFNDPLANVQELASATFQVAPVPANDHLLIRVRQDPSAAYNLRLSDALGRAQVFGSLRNGALDLDVAHLADGVYIVSLMDERSHLVGSRRIVITHH